MRLSRRSKLLLPLLAIALASGGCASRPEASAGASSYRFFDMRANLWMATCDDPSHEFWRTERTTSWKQARAWKKQHREETGHHRARVMTLPDT